MPRPAASAQGNFIKCVRNHRELGRVLLGVSPTTNFAWLDGVIADICRYWLRLARNHLQTALTLSQTPREWRATMSRCYYSAYNASRSVRYYVKGVVQLDADDHKLVGDLPDDFPDRLAWSNFATELRR